MKDMWLGAVFGVLALLLVYTMLPEDSPVKKNLPSVGQIYDSAVAAVKKVVADKPESTDLVASDFGSNYADDNSPEHLAWCDRIYHQNVGCPKHGKVVIPPEVLAEQEAHHLAWCDRIYHRNVSCPLFGKVTVPEEVLKKEEEDHRRWCQSISFQNVGCGKYLTNNEAQN